MHASGHARRCIGLVYRVLSALRASVPGRPCGFKCDDNRQDSG
jgi:hypothetical protein